MSVKKLTAIVLFVCTIATSAHAVTRWSYNSSQWSPVRTLSEWLVGGKGFNVTQTVTYTHNNGCLQVIVTYYAGPFITGQTITQIC